MRGGPPRKMSKRRLEALIIAAEFGLDERAYDIKQSTGVPLDGTKEEVREAIRDYLDPTLGGYLRDYTAEDLHDMVADHRSAREAITVLNHLEGTRARNRQRSRARQQGAAS